MDENDKIPPGKYSFTYASGSGGGTSHADSSKQGTYTLHNGDLVLKYQSGETQKHSFFASDGETVTAIIDGQLMQVTQWNGNDGWEWNGKKKQPLPVEKAKDIRYNFFTGISALKKPSMNIISKSAVTREEKGYSLNYSIYKTTSGILFPYSEEDETGDQSYEVKFTNILVNDPAALNWKDPETL